MNIRPLPLLLPAALLLAVNLGLAQPGPAASGPRMGPGGGMGMMGRGRFGPDYTPGWPMMSPAERSAHRDRMLGFKTQAECRAYMEEHHRLMQERAKQRGRSIPAQPRRDPCAGLPG